MSALCCFLSRRRGGGGSGFSLEHGPFLSLLRDAIQHFVHVSQNTGWVDMPRFQPASTALVIAGNLTGRGYKGIFPNELSTVDSRCDLCTKLLQGAISQFMSRDNYECLSAKAPTLAIALRMAGSISGAAGQDSGRLALVGRTSGPVRGRPEHGSKHDDGDQSPSRRRT